MKPISDPPSEGSCFRLATAYLSRRAASRQQLRRYLLRKVGRAQTADGAEAPSVETMIEAVLDRLQRLQLIDDSLLGQSRARTLAAKGYSGRHMRTHLARQGFETSDPAIASSLAVEDDAQALRFAQRKRLGPFATGTRQPSFERDVRSLVRAGFAVDVAMRVLRGHRDAPPLGDDGGEGRMNER